MVAYHPHSLFLLKTLFLSAFLINTSLMAMNDDGKDGHLRIIVNGKPMNLPSHQGAPGGPDDQRRANLITDLEGRFEEFNNGPHALLYRQSKAITDFLNGKNTLPVPRGFEATMSYLQILLSKDAATFQTSWKAIIAGMDVALTSPGTALEVLNKNMQQVLGIGGPTTTGKTPSTPRPTENHPASSNLPAAAVPAVIAPEECCGGYSACCRSGGCCAGGVKAWLKSVVHYVCPCG